MKKVRGYVLAAAVSMVGLSAASGQDINVEHCKSYGPVFRADAEAGRALLARLEDRIPDDLKQRAIDGDPTVFSEYAAATDSAGVASEYMISALRLLAPLLDYTNRADLIASVYEACVAKFG